MTSIQKGTLDWERALRCLRHALQTTPSPEYWRRVLLIAPCYRSHSQHVPTPGVVFSSEMICEATIDRTMELLKLTKSGRIFIHAVTFFFLLYFFFLLFFFVW